MKKRSEVGARTTRLDEQLDQQIAFVALCFSVSCNLRCKAPRSWCGTLAALIFGRREALLWKSGARPAQRSLSLGPGRAQTGLMVLVLAQEGSEIAEERVWAARQEGAVQLKALLRSTWK